MKNEKYIKLIINEDGSYSSNIKNLTIIEIIGLLKITTKLYDFEIIKEAEKQINNKN